MGAARYLAGVCISLCLSLRQQQLQGDAMSDAWDEEETSPTFVSGKIVLHVADYVHSVCTNITRPFSSSICGCTLQLAEAGAENSL